MPLSWVGKLLAKLRRRKEIMGVLPEIPALIEEYTANIQDPTQPAYKMSRDELFTLGRRGPYHGFADLDKYALTKEAIFEGLGVPKELLKATTKLCPSQEEIEIAQAAALQSAGNYLHVTELFELGKRGPYRRFANFPSGALTVEVDREKYTEALDTLRTTHVAKPPLTSFSCYETVGFTKPEHMEVVATKDEDGSVGAALVDRTVVVITPKSEDSSIEALWRECEQNTANYMAASDKYYKELMEKRDTYEWPASSGL